MRLTAWVPDDDPERDWGIGAALAVGWVDQRCREEAARGVLVTNVRADFGVPELTEFARRNSTTSRRSKSRPPGSGPVLSYVPDLENLEFAMRLARGTSLAVVETVALPLAGWAAWFGSWNLVADEPTPPLSPEFKKEVERLKFYGNNGFGDQFGKDRARSILRDLRTLEDFDRDVLLGAVLAIGVSARGVKNLSKLM